MDVTTMQSTNLLINQIKRDYSDYTFRVADEFWWSTTDRTIYYNPSIDNCLAFLLHELSHALLEHRGYSYDITLVKLERDAWGYAATTLAPLYNITISDDLIQDNLDTYRAWMHARSSCPSCGTTGIQIKNQSYRCLGCTHNWRANDARLKALRRYTTI